MMFVCFVFLFFSLLINMHEMMRVHKEPMLFHFKFTSKKVLQPLEYIYIYIYAFT